MSPIDLVHLFVFEIGSLLELLVVSLAEDLDVVGAAVPDADEDQHQDEDLVGDLVAVEERDRDETQDDVNQLEQGEDQGRLPAERVQGFAFLQKA